RGGCATRPQADPARPGFFGIPQHAGGWQSTPVSSSPSPTTASSPTAKQIRTWRRYLAAERAEAAVYRDIAARREGEEREILLALADAESRHEAHWIARLGAYAEPAPRPDLRTRFFGFLARRL